MKFKIELTIDIPDKQLPKLVHAALEQGHDYEDPGTRTLLMRLIKSTIVEEFGNTLGMGMSHEIEKENWIQSKLTKS